MIFAYSMIIATTSVCAACRFTHDAIRVGQNVFVCDTGQGHIVQLSFPSMAVIRTLDLFTAKEHINTLAAMDDKSIWVVLHNLGKVRLEFSMLPCLRCPTHAHATPRREAHCCEHVWNLLLHIVPFACRGVLARAFCDRFHPQQRTQRFYA